MKAAIIIAGMLAVDAAALAWVGNGFRSSGAAWRKIRNLRFMGDRGFDGDR